jgi:hypothetical protein
VKAAANRKAATPRRSTGALRFITKKRQENPREAVLIGLQKARGARPPAKLDRAGAVIGENS